MPAPSQLKLVIVTPHSHFITSVDSGITIGEILQTRDKISKTHTICKVYLWDGTKASYFPIK